MRTSKADKNYLSISNNIVEYYSGTDHPMPGVIPDPPVLKNADGPQWDAVLKICDGTSGLHLKGFNGPQGQENVVDCNAGAHNCSVEGYFGEPAQVGDQVITVKGGCHDLKFAGMIFSRGRNAVIVIGAWSDQSTKISYNLDFSDLVMYNSESVTFVLARCKNVKLPPHAKVLRFKSLGYSIYWWAKFVAVKLGFFGLWTLVN